MLETIENIFNENFKNELITLEANLKKETYLEFLLNFCKKNNYLDDETIESISEKYQQTLLNDIIVSDKVDVEEDDVQFLITERMYDYIIFTNKYFKTIKPFDLINRIKNEGFISLLNEAKDYNNQMFNRLHEKFKNLKDMSKGIYIALPEYKTCIDNIESLLRNGNIKENVYFLLNENSIKLNKNMNFDELEKYIDCLTIESSIISQFSTKDVIGLISKLKIQLISFEEGMITNDFSNLCYTILTHYFYSSFYVENYENLHMSAKTMGIIMLEMNQNAFSKEEMLDILANGKINFTTEQQNYIIDNYINIMNFNDKSNIATFIRN